MSSLVVLCPHCLTWIEVHSQCCPECAGRVEIEDRDPAPELLDEKLGEWLADLGSAKLLRRGWPNIGRILATTQGLLFVPSFVVHSHGALSAVVDDTLAGSERVRSVMHWWSLPTWRRPVEVSRPAELPEQSTLPLRDLLYNSPGAFFVARDSIRRIAVRWGRIQIDRTPSRMVSLSPHPPDLKLRDSLRKLIDYAPWRPIVAGL